TPGPRCWRGPCPFGVVAGVLEATTRPIILSHSNIQDASGSLRIAAEDLGHVRALVAVVEQGGGQAGMIGTPGQTNYTAAKAGIIGFTKAMAKEYGGRNIAVNAVSPGLIPTDLTAGLPQEVKDGLVGVTPRSAGSGR